MAEIRPAIQDSTLPADLSSVAGRPGLALKGRRVGMITFSSYPADPRPRRTAEALIAEGMSVDVICLADDSGRPRRETYNNLKLLRIPIHHRRGGKVLYAFNYASFIFVSAAVLAARALRLRYDLIYVHNMPDVLVVSSLIPKALGAKVILDLHDPMPELMMTIFKLPKDSRSVKLMRRLEKWSIERVHLALTVNIACKRIFSSRSCAPSKVAVVMNSPDESIFPLRAPRLRQTTTTQGSRFVIMYHGSLVERNGLDLAVDALETIRHTLREAELRVYGHVTPFLEKVLSRAQKAGLDRNLHYMGPRRLDELIREIEACDIGIIPNHRNSFTEINTPTRIFEYLALGKPVIAPRTPGIEDYFSADSLLFFEPGNSDELADRILYAFSHPAEVFEIAKRGQEIYRAHTWSRQRGALLSLVSRILKPMHCNTSRTQGA